MRRGDRNLGTMHRVVCNIFGVVVVRKGMSSNPLEHSKAACHSTWLEEVGVVAKDAGEAAAMGTAEGGVVVANNPLHDGILEVPLHIRLDYTLSVNVQGPRMGGEHQEVGT